MAAINFVKGEQYYTAEFQIKGPVNVHIERAEAGALYFRQRSIDHGSYDLINGANWNNRGDLTIDTAIQGVVYPMWIKIESASEPTLAEMVEGEQSGGGAGESKYTPKYYSVKLSSELNFDDFKTGLGGIALMKINFYGTIMILGGYAGSIMFQETPYNEVIAIAFMPVQEAGVLLNTFADYVAKSTWKDFVEYSEITEDEFYNLSSEEDSGGLEEGDVLYYRRVTPGNYKDLISSAKPGNLVTGITQLAVSACMGTSTGNSYSNQYWDSWNVQDNNIYKETSSAYLAEAIDAVKFTVDAKGRDLPTVIYEEYGINRDDQYVQITQEEYENIFNS